MKNENQSILQELINYSNSVAKETRFCDYNDYIKAQTEEGLSHEINKSKWADGQKKCIDYYFKDLDRRIAILDICCGDGVGLERLRDLGFINITGVEIADSKIKNAKKHGKVFKMDVCSGPFNFDDKFDVIYSSHTLEHVLNPEYTIKQILNFLKDDGFFILVLPYPDIKSVSTENKHNFRVHCGSIPLGLHINDKAKTTLNRISEMGLKVIECEFKDYRESEIHLVIKKDKINTNG